MYVIELLYIIHQSINFCIQRIFFLIQSVGDKLRNTRN